MRPPLLTLFVSFLIDSSYGGGGGFLRNLWLNALKQTVYEQSVEDVNAVHKIDNHLSRRLIVMPLADIFTSKAHGMHGKVQYGDKCSLPGSIGRLIFEKPFEVPWIFEVIPVKRALILAENGDIHVDGDASDTDEASKGSILKKAYCSPLDFRSPENYIFMPQWLMKSLGLQTNDLVDVSFVRIKLAALIVLQPLTPSWDDLLEGNVDPQVLLEREVNKYSSLTTGSTIAIEIHGNEYSFYVKDAKSEGNVSVKGVRIQDSDVKVDIDRSYLDELKKRKESEDSERQQKET